MAKRRVRLTDENDPLNSTDRVLAGFEQVSKITSQLPNKPTSHQVNQLVSQEDNKSTSQQANKSSSQQSLSSSEPELEPVPANELVDKSLSQLPNKPTSQKDNKLVSRQDNKSTSQQVNKPKLRKSTFQISEEVLDRLEQLHLELQLELGKKEAPYKEVIVEEAIVQLLKQINSNRAELLEVLAKRQTERVN